MPNWKKILKTIADLFVFARNKGWVDKGGNPVPTGNTTDDFKGPKK